MLASLAARVRERTGWTPCSQLTTPEPSSVSLGERLPGLAYATGGSYLAWNWTARISAWARNRRGVPDRAGALGRGLDFGAPGDGFVRVTIGTSSALLADIVDRMAAAVGA